jgi:uncharacterized OB-fold protein
MGNVKMSPSLIRPEEEYRTHLAAGRFMLLRSRVTGKHLFYPRIAAPGTGCRELEWVAASGRGEVYATTVVRPKPPQSPYNVALIALSEGPRMMSRVEGIDPEEVRIGMAVQARIAVEEGSPLVVFDVEKPR